MRDSVPVDLLAEVLVVSDKNSILAHSQGKDGVVIETAGIVIDRKDVVTGFSQPARNSRPGAFVNQESHN